MTDNSQRFKKGDRVRWTGAHNPTVANASARGQLGTVTRDTRQTSKTTEVLWDIGEDRLLHDLGTSIYNGNLELISLIDTTKPLQIVSTHLVGTRSATFITETSDGHILVDASGFASSWFIFDKQGNFLRSSDNSGSALQLRNKSVATSEYVPVTKSGATVTRIDGYRNRQLAWDENPEADHLIQIDKLDGVVTGVGVLKRKEK